MDKINSTINKHISKEQYDVCNYLKEHFSLNNDEFAKALNSYYENQTIKPKKCASFLSNGFPCQNRCIQDMNVCGMHKNKIHNNAICQQVQTDSPHTIKCMAVNKINGFQCTFSASDDGYCKKHKNAMNVAALRKTGNDTDIRCVHIIDISDMGDNICCERTSKHNMWVCGYHRKYQSYLENEYKSSNLLDYNKLVEEKKIKRNLFIEDTLNNKNDM
jgi:hypothetical protein